MQMVILSRCKSAFVLMIVVVAVIGYATATFFMQKKARIALPESMWDFGPVEPGLRLEHTFVVLNTGNAPLVIDAVKSSCGCLNTVLEEDRIMPQQKASLKVQLKAAKYRKPVDERIFVSTNDKLNPQVLLRIKANVEPKIAVNPSTFNFGVLSKSDLPCSRNLRSSVRRGLFRQGDHNGPKWTVSSTDPVGLRPKVLPDPNDPNVCVITATLSKTNVAGPISVIIRLSATGDNGESASREISCLGKILGPMAVVPDSVVFDLNRRNGSRSVELSVVRGEGVRLRPEIGSSLQGYVSAHMVQSEVVFDLSPKSEKLNEQPVASRIVGTVWLIDEQSSERILSIPTVVIGK